MMEQFTTYSSLNQLWSQSAQLWMWRSIHSVSSAFTSKFYYKKAGSLQRGH